MDYKQTVAAVVAPLLASGLTLDEARAVVAIRLDKAFAAFRANPHADAWTALETAMIAHQAIVKNPEMAK